MTRRKRLRNISRPKLVQRIVNVLLRSDQGTNFLHVRSKLNILESLFTGIHGQKFSQFCVEKFDSSKQYFKQISTAENDITSPKNEAKKITNFLHLRDQCDRFILLELLFTRMYGKKLAQLFVENYENFIISKYKFLLGNSFGTNHHFKIIFTVLVKSPQRRKA